MAVTEGSEAFDSDIVQEVRSFFYGCNRALGYRLFWRHLPEMSEAMDGEILAGVKVWFDSFSSHFMDSDEEVKRHVQMKREHTRRTCDEILYLAERLNLNEERTRLAEAIALLHDVGRFPQFAGYRTFNDARSVDHGSLGVEVLGTEQILTMFGPCERNVIETAVRFHGHKSIPDGLEDEALFFLKLIRDADKLDILNLSISYYRDARTRGVAVLGFPDVPQISRDVLEAVLERRLIEYDHLQSLNDFRLCQIGWVYDINFTPSLEKLVEGGILDELFGFLPGTSEVEEVRRVIRRYVASRLNG